MIISDDGTPDFHALRSQHRGHEAVLVAFDLLERDGEDLRDLPLIERKRRLGRLIGKTKNRRAIQYGEHLKGNGASVLDDACRLGPEGIVSKRVDAPYRSGPSKDVAHVEEPGQRGGAAGTRGGMPLDPPTVIRCMNSAAST